MTCDKVCITSFNPWTMRSCRLAAGHEGAHEDHEGQWYAPPPPQPAYRGWRQKHRPCLKHYDLADLKSQILAAQETLQADKVAELKSQLLAAQATIGMMTWNAEEAERKARDKASDLACKVADMERRLKIEQGNNAFLLSAPKPPSTPPPSPWARCATCGVSHLAVAIAFIGLLAGVLAILLLVVGSR